MSVTWYSDTDFVADKTERKSVSGGFEIADGMTMMWICRKQGDISLLTVSRVHGCVRDRTGVAERHARDTRAAKITEGCMRATDRYAEAALKQLKGEKATLKAKHIDVRIKFVMLHTWSEVLKPEHCESGKIPVNVPTQIGRTAAGLAT